MFSLNDENDRPVAVAIVNVSPIEWGHFLLVPRLEDNLAQRLSSDSIQIGLEMINLSKDKYFRLMYNSLLAWASGLGVSFVIFRTVPAYGNKREKMSFKTFISEIIIL